MVASTLTDAGLGTRLDAGVAAYCAAETAMISLAGEVEESGWWKRAGARSAADWLAHRYKLSVGVCAGWVEAARRLRSRPAVGAALESGTLTPAQAVPLLARLDALEAPSDADSVAVGVAASTSVSVLRAEARQAVGVSREEALARHRQQALRFTPRPETGMSHLEGWFADADAAAIDVALRRRARQMPVDPNTGKHAPWEARLAWALREICGTALSSDSDPDRATIVIHATEGAQARVHHGPALADETFSRLLCDSRIQALIEKADGKLLAAAETLRTVPEWLRRFVEHRDGGCTFPSCGRTRTLLHCHHIRHWDHGGLTEPENLTTLCHVHHHTVHEGGWDITRRGDGTLHFRPPDDGGGGGGGPGPPGPATWEEASAELTRFVDEVRAERRHMTSWTSASWMEPR